MEPNRTTRTIQSVDQPPSDAADWTLAVAGEGEAFGRVFDRHHDRVLRHSRRLVAQSADVDDVVAITFLEAWRNRARVRLVNDSVLPWLLVTATNVASNTNRGVRRYRALLAGLPAASIHVDPIDHETSDALNALARLSLADRRVVVLCVLEGYSEREAASALGVPPGTVKSRLSRAKGRIRAQLETPSLQHSLVEETRS